MAQNITNTETALSEAEIQKRLTWFRNLSEFYRRNLGDGECNPHEVDTFESEKNAFLKAQRLENIY